MDNKSTPHRFTLACREASEKDYCWKLNCTTCGCIEFLKLLQRKASVEIPLLERYAQNNMHSGQEKLLILCKDISFQELKEQVPNFENMLGYIGVVLSATEDGEKNTRILTKALAPGMIDYLDEKGGSADYFRNLLEDENKILTWQDLARLETE